MAGKKAAAPLNEPAKQADQTESGIYLDPDLAKIRDAEAERNNVEIKPRPEALLDPALKPSK